LSASGQILPKKEKNAFGIFFTKFVGGEQMETLIYFIFGKKWISEKEI